MYTKLLAILLSLHTNIHTNHNYAVVDFSLSSKQERFFVYNYHGQLVYSTYVSHGIGSGRGEYAVKFSNEFNSKASSLGKYVIKEVYYGKHGKSYRVEGLDNTDSNAYKRMIEVHGASYIGNGKTGHSFGCFAIPQKDLHIIMEYLKPGDYIYAKK